VTKGPPSVKRLPAITVPMPKISLVVHKAVIKARLRREITGDNLTITGRSTYRHAESIRPTIPMASLEAGARDGGAQACREGVNAFSRQQKLIEIGRTSEGQKCKPGYTFATRVSRLGPTKQIWGIRPFGGKRHASASSSLSSSTKMSFCRPGR
jgi:hypothetical protein